MILGTLNTDKSLSDELSKQGITIVPLDINQSIACDAFFIDFHPTKSDKTPQKAAKLVAQAFVLEESVKKKKPVLLFDRYLGLTKKEYNWLNSTKIRFLEPALNYRSGFYYLPFWYKQKKLNDIQLNNNERQYCLGYKGNIIERIKSFEKYYVYYAKLYPNNKVVYNKEVDKIKKEEYKNFGIEKKDFDYSEVQYTFIIGTNLEYKIGYLDSFIFKALESNCIPIIPPEHRYFGLIQSYFDLHIINNMYDQIYIGMLCDLYENLEKYYPEMEIKNVAGEIINHIKDIMK